MKKDALEQPLTARGKRLRIQSIELAKPNGGYHFGGSFSAIEILIALFDHVLVSDPANKFVMSKGHACWPYYVLLQEQGYTPLLEGHPHIGNGVNYTTGSMGHGMPATMGMALARKVQNAPGELFVLVGDGECQEGTTWESMLIASKLGIDNLTVIVDLNGIQGSGHVSDILPVDALGECARAIGWETISVNGHDINKLVEILGSAKKKMPRMVLCHTIKGKGVPFMEDEPSWHAQWVDDEREDEIREMMK